jgi:hypothetical protein
LRGRRRVEESLNFRNVRRRVGAALTDRARNGSHAPPLFSRDRSDPTIGLCEIPKVLATTGAFGEILVVQTKRMVPYAH